MRKRKHALMQSSLYRITTPSGQYSVIAPTLYHVCEIAPGIISAQINTVSDRWVDCDLEQCKESLASRKDCRDMAEALSGVTIGSPLKFEKVEACNVI
jgi:hypothetical protein